VEWKLIFRATIEHNRAVAVVFFISVLVLIHDGRLNTAADTLSVSGVEWSAKEYDTNQP
jgi:hypothetical protein